MKVLSLLLWVSQFSLSIIFPALFFLILSVWLRNQFGFGLWIVFLFGFIGFLTSIQTARSSLRSLRKAAEDASGDRETPISFNDHQ